MHNPRLVGTNISVLLWEEARSDLFGEYAPAIF